MGVRGDGDAVRGWQEQPTHRTMRRCKRRQYIGVQAGLQFLCPLLTRWCAESRQGAELPADLDTYRSLMEQVTESGAPESPQHAGPLTLEQLGTFQSPLWSALLRQVFRATPTAMLGSTATLRGVPRQRVRNIFPCAESALLGAASAAALWTSSTTARYVDAVAAIHASRPSRNLSEDGYLRESGLLTRSVLGDGDEADADVQQRWRALVDATTLFLPDRSAIHEIENVPQEIAIGELVVQCAVRLQSAQQSPTADPPSAQGSLLDCVVDVGGGNGFLAAQVGERVGCDSVVIDPFFPSHAIDCCPRQWADTPTRVRPATRRLHTVRRVVAEIGATQWDRDVGVDPQRCALIAKHLCGTAIDTCLRHLDSQGRLPRVLVLVPCCFHKGHYASYVNQPFLGHVLGVTDQDGYGNIARLTDWNVSTYQSLDESPDSKGPPTALKRHASARAVSRKSVGHLVSCGDALARTVEAILNAGRVNWLQDRGYVAEVLAYVPSCVTPKNKCIVAYRP